MSIRPIIAQGKKSWQENSASLSRLIKVLKALKKEGGYDLKKKKTSEGLPQPVREHQSQTVYRNYAHGRNEKKV